MPDWTIKDGELLKYDGSDSRVVIPEGVQVIGEGVFREHKEIQEVVFPQSLVEIRNSAFRNCAGLKELFFPARLKLVCRGSFEGCASVKRLLLPAGFTLERTPHFLHESFFMYLRGLEAVETDFRNPAYSSLDGVLYDRSRITLLLYPPAKRGRFVLPAEVKRIGPYAFSGSNVEEVILPQNLLEIGDYAFYYCDKLKRVGFNTGLRTIGHAAFDGCSALKDVSLPDGLRNFGASAFSSLVSLEHMRLPADCTYEKYNFIGVPSLKKITLSPFAREVPEAIRDITTLERVECGQDSLYFRSVDGVLFSIDKKELVYFPRQHSAEYIVPKGTRMIREGAFTGWGKLQRLVLPDTLVEVEEGAFDHPRFEIIPAKFPKTSLSVPFPMCAYLDLEAMKPSDHVLRLFVEKDARWEIIIKRFLEDPKTDVTRFFRLTLKMAEDHPELMSSAHRLARFARYFRAQISEPVRAQIREFVEKKLHRPLPEGYLEPGGLYEDRLVSRTARQILAEPEWQDFLKTYSEQTADTLVHILTSYEEQKEYPPGDRFVHLCPQADHLMETLDPSLREALIKMVQKRIWQSLDYGNPLSSSFLQGNLYIRTACRYGDNGLMKIIFSEYRRFMQRRFTLFEKNADDFEQALLFSDTLEARIILDGEKRLDAYAAMRGKDPDEIRYGLSKEQFLSHQKELLPLFEKAVLEDYLSEKEKDPDLWDRTNRLFREVRDFRKEYLWKQGEHVFAIWLGRYRSADGDDYELDSLPVKTVSVSELEEEEVLRWREFFHARKTKAPGVLYEPRYVMDDFEGRWDDREVSGALVEQLKEAGLYVFDQAGEFLPSMYEIGIEVLNLSRGYNSVAREKELIRSSVVKRLSRRTRYIALMLDLSTVEQRILEDDVEAVKYIPFFTREKTEDFLKEAQSHQCSRIISELVDWLRYFYEEEEEGNLEL